MIYKGIKQELFEDERATEEAVYVFLNVYSSFRRKSRDPEKAPVVYALYVPEMAKYGLELTREEFDELASYAFESYGAESTEQILRDYESGKLQKVKQKVY